MSKHIQSIFPIHELSTGDFILSDANLADFQQYQLLLGFRLFNYFGYSKISIKTELLLKLAKLHSMFDLTHNNIEKLYHMFL